MYYVLICIRLMFVSVLFNVFMIILMISIIMKTLMLDDYEKHGVILLSSE